MPEVTTKYLDNCVYGRETNGEKVPKREYRCKGTSVLTNTTTLTHLCRSVEDHEGPHKCICNHTWPQTAAENKEKN